MQLTRLNVAGLHLSVMEFLAIENERLIPQQSATTLTNIDDIELYVKEKGSSDFFVQQIKYKCL